MNDFKQPALRYIPSLFYKLTNKNRRLFDIMIEQDANVLNHKIFKDADPERLYNFSRWLKDSHIESLEAKKYKGVAVEDYKTQSLNGLKDMDALALFYAETYKNYLIQLKDNLEN
jgi:hypothetical protein